LSEHLHEKEHASRILKKSAKKTKWRRLILHLVVMV